jgi:hypothetical protein
MFGAGNRLALEEHGERAMRRRKLKRLWAGLEQISAMEPRREERLTELGARARHDGLGRPKPRLILRAMA